MNYYEMLIRRSRNATPSIPTDYVFYLPMDTDDATEDQTGHALTKTGTLTASYIDGISCLHFQSNQNYIRTNDYLGLPTGKHPWTQSIWVYNYGSSSGAYFAFGKNNTHEAIHIQRRNAKDIYGGGWFLDYKVDYEFSQYTWYNLIQTYDGEMYSFYVNGELVTTSTNSDVNITSGCVSIGAQPTYSGEYVNNCYMASARIYDRVLTDDEIELLANEHHPIKTVEIYDQSISFVNGVVDSKQLVANPSGCTFSTDDALPEGVTLSSSGLLSFDGSEITEDEELTYTVTASADGYESATATLTIKMQSEYDYLVLDAELDTSTTPRVGTFVSKPTQFTFETDDQGINAVYNITGNNSNTSTGIIYTPARSIGGAKPRTYSIWYKHVNSYQSGLFQHGNKVLDNLLGWSINESNKYGFPWGDRWKSPWASMPAITQNVWHHAVCVYDGVKVVTYTDGVLDATGANVTLATTDTDVIVGSVDGRIFKGYLRKAKIWDTAFDASAVSALYDSEKTEFGL